MLLPLLLRVSVAHRSGAAPLPPKLIAGKQRLRVPCAARFPLLTCRPGAPMLGAWAFDFITACACFPASA
jgi:hypothetical protein